MPETQQRIVPFVAMWSKEVEDLGLAPYNLVEGFLGPRDRRGVLWQTYGDALGEGDPLFAQVHPVRQKMCMEGPYCQVCGTILPPKKTPWLVPELSVTEWNTDLRSPNARPFVTHTPPCCQSCWPVAESLCPHLKRESFFRLIVRDYQPVGIFGDYWPSADPARSEKGLILRFGNPQWAQARKKFIAKQLVVQINRWKVVD